MSEMPLTLQIICGVDYLTLFTSYIYKNVLYNGITTWNKILTKDATIFTLIYRF